MDFKELTQTLPEQLSKLIAPLHDFILQAGCKYRIDINDDSKTLVYSLRNLKLSIKGDELLLTGEYDIRAFLKLYRQTDDNLAKELLFNGVKSCSYCINDKCTTFLMAEQRTIEFDGRTKKLCGPYRHNLKIAVTEESLSACFKAINMMFEYTYPHMHTDLFYKNEVTYTITEKSEFYIVGYMARHNSLSKSDEKLVSSVLRKDKDGRRKVDALLEAVGQADDKKYIGAIDKFANGNDYEFIFGLIADKKPEVLPEGTICRKIRSGEWAVYNSSADDYRSIWKEFSAKFYDKEHKGYDTSRIPFEYYDENGELYDVHIPVDADMPADSAKTVTMLYMPTLRVAGFPMYGEADYPLSKDYPFDVDKRMREAFPYADKFIGMAKHSFFGKPIEHGCYYAYDDLTPIPEDMEKRELRAGWFLIEGRRHFNGGASDYPFDRPMNFRTSVDDAHHPGLWIDLNYVNARGGYTELGNPAHIKGKRKFEVVELQPQRVIGKLEAPPESIVTDEEKKAFYTLPVNREKGSYMIGYTITQPVNAGMYFDKPLIKGVLASDDTSIPEGYSEFMLEGGKFVKITEDMPNGEPGWEIEGYDCIEKETGYAADNKRQFIIKQYDFGRSYEFYVPCGEYTRVQAPLVDELLDSLKVKSSDTVNLSELAIKDGAIMDDGKLVINVENADKPKNRPVTQKEYTLPLKVDVKAKTNSTNIRLSFNNGVLILNWECNKSELRIHDPLSGHQHGFDGGYVTENAEHNISWIINRDYMAVIVDGEIRHYRKCYDYNKELVKSNATITAPVGICSAWGSTVTVKEIIISELGN